MCARPLALVPLLVDVVKAERGSLRVNLLGVLLYICQVHHAPPPLLLGPHAACLVVPYYYAPARPAHPNPHLVTCTPCH